MLLHLLPEDILLAAQQFLLVLLPALDQIAHDAQVLELIPNVDHLLVHAVGYVERLPAGCLAALVLLPEVHLLVEALVVLLEETGALQLVDIPTHEDVHGLEADHHVVSGASRAVANSPAVRTQPIGFLLAIVVILEAVLAILPAADILIIFMIKWLLSLL